MATYAKDDCRNHGGPIKGLPTTMEFVVETKKGPNRKDLRKMKAVYRNRQTGVKNTKGVPLGFNKVTWDAHCKALKEMN